LLANADPARGEGLVTRYGCTSCHAGAGAQNRLAPEWTGLAERAADRHPPLPAAAYVYESIVYPRAVEIEGYSGQMPLIYARTIPEADLGDILAYLLEQ
jgi:mono/diheme cytochrome c family protein